MGSMDKIKKILGKPYYENDGCVIYCADSIDSMKKINDTLIDLTITSPPYNIGKEYETNLALHEYIKWSRDWIKGVYDITKPNGTFWLNVSYLPISGKGKAVPIPYLLWDKTDFYFIQEVVWNYGAGVAGRKFYSPRNEKLLWYVKNEQDYTFNLDSVRDPNVKYPNQKKNGKLKCNPIGKNPSDVWQIAKVTSGKNRSSAERTSHPAQFPIALIDRVLKASSNPGDLVFDPFLGSGTSAIVALSNQRKFIGIEIDKRYCDIAIKRIESHLNKPEAIPLFELLPTAQAA